MKLSDLRRISKCHHISEFTEESLVTNLGLYDCVLIDTSGVSETHAETNESAKTTKAETHISVSKDVKALHKFLNSCDPITLPCPSCAKDQPFKPLGLINGIDAIREYNSRNNGIGYMRLNNPNSIERDDENDEISLVDRLEYSFGTDEFSITKHSVFDTLEGAGGDFYYTLATKCVEGIMHEARDFRKDYECTLDPSHRCSIGFVIEKAIDASSDNRGDDNGEEKMFQETLRNVLVMKKVFQYPSMADMQLFDSRKYQNILKNNYCDYRRALGLYASGIGAGSFVYLRRVMESIVEEIHKECMVDSRWDEKSYNSLHFNEKIELMEKKYKKSIIPRELHQVKEKIYGALSKGVHELSEEECKELFLYFKDAIDIILDERIRKQEKEDRIKEINKRLESIPKN